MIRWTPVTPDLAPRSLDKVFRDLPFTDSIGVLSRLEHAPLLLFNRAAKSQIVAYASSRREESGGLLLGHAITAGQLFPDFHPMVYIHSAIPSANYEGTGVSLRMEPDVWTAAREHKNIGLLVVGWFHSHPNLGAFFSGTDRKTQKDFFHHEYSVGYVIDPVRDEHAFFLGRDSAEMRATTVLEVSAVPRIFPALQSLPLSGTSSPTK